MIPDPVRFLFYFAGSPADLHGMWYPPVRRVLATLSRLYRCVDRGIFQGLSSEALAACVSSVSKAASMISARSVNYSFSSIRLTRLLLGLLDYCYNRGCHGSGSMLHEFCTLATCDVFQ